MRGAAFLASLNADISKQSALVVDIGGTTTDIGMRSGLPRQAAAHHNLCGVSLNFSMPHVTSIGLGGGSLVRRDSLTHKVTVGPIQLVMRSPLRHWSLADPPDSTRVASMDLSLVKGMQRAIKVMLQNTLDVMKIFPENVPIYLVGGGSILAPDELDGVSRVHRFPHRNVANAVGAAIAQISGIVDSFEDTTSLPITEVRKAVEARAMECAISAGAEPHTVTIVESEAIPIAYTTGRCRFYVKAAGEWSGHSISIPRKATVIPVQLRAWKWTSHPKHHSTSFRPALSPLLHMWFLSETDLKWIADACYILGCGGGGSPPHAFLELGEMVRNGSIIRVVDLSSVPQDAMIGWGGGMGSPEVTSERLLGNEYNEACAELWAFVGIAKPDVLCALEIGGANRMINICSSSWCYRYINIYRPDDRSREQELQYIHRRRGSHVLCLDIMRSTPYHITPQLSQTTPSVFDESGRGLNLLPCALYSGDGNIMRMTKAKRETYIDSSLRAACVEMGTHVGLATRPFRAQDLQPMMITNTSKIGHVGHIIVDAVGGGSAKVPFAGKITDVRRQLYKGHTIGEVVITALPPDEDYPPPGSMDEFTGKIIIPFKNENLYAEHTSEQGQKTAYAQTGSALGTQEYKYSLRVVVIGIVGAPQWTSTPRGMEVGGPSAFGYVSRFAFESFLHMSMRVACFLQRFHEIPYVPLGMYAEPKSVVKEYTRQI
ncbi:hypothetical protein SCLCIDRAFT_27186 [Scleroderma citrinum Foug A]|uniref:Uncharacterized protein n=1 Tax=Scleroderma citrinum Foug A TaxID=1036808 RepID=A0A0C3DTZ5_9AGAM|nr:hypothetical protein SCLCIDRAFT_27186 [Scleroderma citrinum Foug A]